LAIRRIAQKRINTALVFDRANRRGGDAQPDRAQNVREDTRSLQIGQIAPFGLIVGMADIVPDLDSLAGDRASPRHGAPRSNATSERLARPLSGRASSFYPLPSCRVKRRPEATLLDGINGRSAGTVRCRKARGGYGAAYGGRQSSRRSGLG